MIIGFTMLLVCAAMQYNMHVQLNVAGNIWRLLSQRYS